MINALIYMLVVFIIIGLVIWVLDYIPVPEPLNRIGKLIAIVIGVLVVIMVLLRLAGVDIGTSPGGCENDGPVLGRQLNPAVMTLVAWIMAGLFVAAVVLGFVL